MTTTPSNTPPKTSKTPLAHGDVPEQDGSEDPGASMEPVREPAASPDAAREDAVKQDSSENSETADTPDTDKRRRELKPDAVNTTTKPAR